MYLIRIYQESDFKHRVFLIYPSDPRYSFRTPSPRSHDAHQEKTRVPSQWNISGPTLTSTQKFDVTPKLYVQSPRGSLIGQFFHRRSNAVPTSILPSFITYSARVLIPFPYMSLYVDAMQARCPVIGSYLSEHVPLPAGPASRGSCRR